jgi:hypothetical protein
MKSIHVIYGQADMDISVCAHKLAVEQPRAFVHEIAGSEDVRLVLASQYERCIATLRATSEAMARSRMLEMAAAARSQLCHVTFERAAALG